VPRAGSPDLRRLRRPSSAGPAARGDSTWTGTEELISQAKGRLEYLGPGDANRVEAGYVVRMPKAYPVDDEHSLRNVDNTVPRSVENVGGAGAP
jgi:hypothetical protein